MSAYLCFFWFVFLLAVVCLVAIPFQKSIEHTSLFALLATLAFIGSLFLATYTFGYGKVTNRVEAFDMQLKTGVVYQTVTSSKVGEKNYVILVKEFPGLGHFALRVETLPPETFVLIDGQPVEIYNPSIKPSLH